ncbi:MAG: hypothetical protein JWP12_3966 [Bacteroidetes bacterium]|nr:hypothetical protein [Bacteroidota bacterium]
MQKMKLFKLKLLLLPLFTMVLLSACKKENACDCIKRTGSIITEIRHKTGFTEVFVENNLNVFITQDSTFEIKVEAGENVAGLITTEVENGVLYVRNRNRCNWTRSYEKPLNVYISMPVITYITSDGTGNIKGMNAITTPTVDVQIKNSGNIDLILNNQVLRTHMHGSGDVTLHGYSHDHYCSIGGTAYLYASDLETSYTFIDAFTLGESYIAAKDLLICKLEEKGDIYCYGQPVSVQKDRQGTGELYIK